VNSPNPPPDDASALTHTHGGAEVTPTQSPATTTWGPFALLEEVGRGGFATVYRAWDPQLRREIALKLMLPSRMRPGSGDEMLREGQLIARVRHPNVVTVYSVQREGDAIGLAMEFVRGRTLAALVEQHGPMDAADAAVVGSHVCDALDAVHALGLVHRDVKASNVMREDSGRIVLMDFGAGRDSSGDRSAPSGIIGTPQYVAPELLLGARVTAASDLYSVAVLLFFLVTGSHPVEGNDFAEVGRAHRAGRRRLLRDTRPDLPAPFIELVDTALYSEPSKRLQTASAFRRALQATLPADRQFRPSSQSTQVSDYRPPSGQTAAPLTGVQRLLLTLAGVAVLCGAMGFITTTAFNLVLRRTGEFAAEGVLAYFVWGIRSLVAPTVWVVTLLLAFNLVALAVRTVARHVPPVQLAFRTLTEQGRRALDALNMRNANALGQGLSVVAGAGLAAIAWLFSDLLGALASNVNDSPSSELSVFGSGHYDTHVSYRLTLNLVVLMLAAGIVTVLRYARRHAETMHLATYVGMIGVLCLALVMMALPWRVLFSDTFAMGAFGERRCFILGETSESTLISCPAAPAPRNIVLRRGDPRLSDEHSLGSIFDAFEAASASQ
jgi:hypothetical protein